MMAARFRHRLGAAALIVLASGCARATDLVVLLPDPETGAVGQATVRGEGGSVDLATAGEGTRVRATGTPSKPAAIPQRELDRTFGAALASRPQAARHFVLQFAAGDTLTPESQRLLPEIVAEVRSRQSPEVSVIGHTDRTGDAAANAALGLRRAETIRALLVRSGIAATVVDVSSHGESDPAVPTADGVDEPRNRRVEVTVR